MRAAISRYGARVFPETEDIVARLQEPRRVHPGSADRASSKPRSRAPRARAIAAITAAYGRMAFYYMLQGARSAARLRDHLSVADLLGRAGAGARRRAEGGVRRRRPARRSPSIPAVGRADDHRQDARDRADAPVRPAVRHGRDPGDRGAPQSDRPRGLRARARRDVYKGRPVGTFGTGALFSFQTLKPLNCYGGGAALVHGSDARRKRPRASSTRCRGRAKSGCATGC